jgi:tetratricopeptide (TPR) repeat protein
MNGRFSRLELGDRKEHTEQVHPSAGTPIRTAEAEVEQAVSAYRSGRFEPALQSYTRALRSNRALVAAWVGQVQMLVELGEYKEARLWSDKALELFRGCGDLLAAKSRACVREGDLRAALACSDASLQSVGVSALRWAARGEVMLESKSNRARDCFDKALAEPGTDWFDRIVIARIYLFHRRPAPGLPLAQSAVEMAPGDPYAWYVLGRCQELLSWRAAARTSFERAIELDRGFEQAAAAIRGLKSNHLRRLLTLGIGGRR